MTKAELQKKLQEYMAIQKEMANSAPTDQPNPCGEFTLVVKSEPIVNDQNIHVKYWRTADQVKQPPAYTYAGDIDELLNNKPLKPIRRGAEVDEGVPLDEKQVSSCDQIIRQVLQIQATRQNTLLVAVVIDLEQPKSNTLNAIPCAGGVPLAGYPYDAAKDAYLIPCVQYRKLGVVPLSYEVSMPGVAKWKAAVPLPIQAIRELLTEKQRQALEEYQRAFPQPRFDISFVQLIGAY